MHSSSSKSSSQQKNIGNLKSKVDGNELDLSLSSLEVVPVKELAAIPKATNLDLSCNLLVTIGNDFGLLTHLVKLDLSKNRLTSLPDDFGRLTRLQHLDLYNNQLSVLPLSFSQLSALKWLDLRDNPTLDPALKQQAGDCLNETQCRKCAKQVVEFMRNCASEAERQKQKRLQEERVRESERKLELELEKQRAQLIKKAEKEKRKKEQAAARQQNAAAVAAESSSDGDRNGSIANASDDYDTSIKSKTKKNKKGGRRGGCILWCLEALVMVALFIAGVFTVIALYCWMNKDSDGCKMIYNEYWPLCRNAVQHELQKVYNLTLDTYDRTFAALKADK